jgi:hypothetical protein
LITIWLAVCPIEVMISFSRSAVMRAMGVETLIAATTRFDGV